MAYQDLKEWKEWQNDCQRKVTQVAGNILAGYSKVITTINTLRSTLADKLYQAYLSSFNYNIYGYTQGKSKLTIA